MSEFEKRAWWNLWIAVGAVVLFAALFLVTRNAAASTGAFGVLGLSGLPYFWRPRLCDERDREIDRRSTITAMGAFWLLLVAGAVGPGFAMGWDAVVPIPVVAFSEAIMGGWLVIMTVKSIATIRMYRAG